MARLKKRRKTGFTMTVCHTRKTVTDCASKDIYSSDHGGDHVGHDHVTRATVSHFDRVAGHVTPQRWSAPAKTEHGYD